MLQEDLVSIFRRLFRSAEDPETRRHVVGDDEDNWPEYPNFASSLYIDDSVDKVAKLFTRAGWTIHNANDHTAREAVCDWAELLIQSKSPTLISGAVLDVERNAVRIVEIVHSVGSFHYEVYGANDKLLFQKLINQKH